MKILLLLLLVSVLGLTACSSVSEEEVISNAASEEEVISNAVSEEEIISNAAPDFELQDLNGDMVKLSDLKGKRVYLKYWASWCSVCLANMEELDELSGENLDFEVLSIVSPGTSGEMDTAEFKEWFKGLNTKNVKVLLDEGGKYAQEYGVRAFPSSAYIDTDGALIKFAVGQQDNDSIKAEFEKMK